MLIFRFIILFRVTTTLGLFALVLKMHISFLILSALLNSIFLFLFFFSGSKIISKCSHYVLFTNSISGVRSITKWPLTCRVHLDLKVGMSLCSTLSSSENPPWHFLCPSQGNLGWTPSHPLWKRHKMIHDDSHLTTTGLKSACNEA